MIDLVSLQSELAIGRPRFLESEVAAVAVREGPLAAWRVLLRRHSPAQALARVEGDYAVALQLDDGRQFLAVDRFATQTLCYRQVGSELRVATSASALAGQGAQLRIQTLFDYLYFHCIPSPETVFEDVRRLPAAHFACFDKGRLSVTPHWLPQFDVREVDFETAKRSFRDGLRQAVARQLDDGPAACFLSGGTDSSTVAGLLNELREGQATSYSIGFDAAGYDEMAYARLAAKHFKLRHREYYITPDDLVRGIPKMAAYLDQPFGNSSVLPAYYCAAMAQADGATRLLAGDGGDELYAGNSRYAKQRLFNAYRQVPKLLRQGLLEPLLLGTPVGRMPGLRKGASYLTQARTPMPDRLQPYNLLTRIGADTVLTPAVLEAVNVEAPLRHQRQVWNAVPECSLLNRELAFDWRYTLGESDLPKVRAATGLAGLEVGFPMLDDELLQLSLSLPDHYKLRGGKLRWFFKEALRGFLPDEILSKRKQGFGLPFGVWTVRTPALHRLAEDSLDGLVQRGLLQGAYVRKLLQEQLPAHPGYFGEMVWILMMLEQWLRQHQPDWRPT